jgi:hypothetical protein
MISYIYILKGYPVKGIPKYKYYLFLKRALTWLKTSITVMMISAANPIFRPNSTPASMPLNSS